MGSCYVMFNQGQKLMLSQQEKESPPRGTGLSYATSMLALAGTYGAEGYALRTLEEGGKMESSSTTHNSTTQASSGFKQPKNIGEFFARTGRPMMLHFGAISVAFFVAGAVQSSIAKSSNRKADKLDL